MGPVKLFTEFSHTGHSPDLRGLLVLLQLQVLQHANGTLCETVWWPGWPETATQKILGWLNINSLFNGTFYHLARRVQAISFEVNK